MVTSVLVAGSGFLSAYAETGIAAVICGSGSSITIAAPQSDSVVTVSTVPLSGTVNQAGQIEIEVDGTYDSVIPLNVGDTNFSGSVELSQGTHTITLTAIDSCGVNNVSASVVVTFTPPPSNGSTGSETETHVATSSQGGVTVGDESTSGEQVPSYAYGLLPAPLGQALDKGLAWLNIATTDNSDHSTPSLSLWRAGLIGLGSYMAIIGIAHVIVQAFAAAPFFAKFPDKRRYIVASRVLRVVGGLLVVAAFVF